MDLNYQRIKSAGQIVPSGKKRNFLESQVRGVVTSAVSQEKFDLIVAILGSQGSCS